jgi:PAS domain S-box-containing protein
MTTELILLYSVLFLFIGIVVFYLLRLITRYFKTKKSLDQEDTSRVGFVVDTFHELVAKLKEKERELDLLRKKAEDRAAAIEGYNENILQSVPSGVISFDEELRITKVNYSAEKILELKPEAVLGRSHSDVLKKPISDLLDDRLVIERKEIVYTTASGRRIWLGMTLSPLKNSSGAVIGQILVFTDLTHLKAIESQMQLRDRLSSLGEISAGIAHELRNPMAVIAGYTKILSKKAESSLAPTVDAISKEIVVMDRIISDFLSFAKPVALAISKVNLKTLIVRCLNSAYPERTDIVRNIEIQGEPIIGGDEVLLRQAFINLIQNSAEAMPQGGTLKITASAPSLAEGGHIDLVFSDTGHGIPADIRDKIFLPFFTTKEKGTGLGLAIVHKIVVSHGGGITVDSDAGGTTFKIRLPLLE